jgi:hypothetical protein
MAAGFAFGAASTPIRGTFNGLPQPAHVNVRPAISAATCWCLPHEQITLTAMGGCSVMTV